MRRLLALPFLLPTFSCAPAEKPLPPGLAMALEFEDAWEPESVAGLSLQVSPPGIGFGSGVLGYAAHFDGSGADLKLRGLDRLGIGGSMTLELFVDAAYWKNPYGPGSGLESLVSHSDIFTVAIDPSSWELQARLTTTAGPESLRLRGGWIQAGLWHHVALVLDGSSGRARLVLDGEVVDEVAAQGTVPVRSDLDLVVGTWFGKNQAFCGALDSIRLWSRALSAEELRGRAELATAARSTGP